MSGKSLGHHLFKLHSLLGRIDLDQRFLGDPDLDTVPAFHCPQHLEFLDLFQFAGRKRAE